jgi:hypothetical protein
MGNKRLSNLEFANDVNDTLNMEESIQLVIHPEQLQHPGCPVNLLKGDLDDSTLDQIQLLDTDIQKHIQK